MNNLQRKDSNLYELTPSNNNYTVSSRSSSSTNTSFLICEPTTTKTYTSSPPIYKKTLKNNQKIIDVNGGSGRRRRPIGINIHQEQKRSYRNMMLYSVLILCFTLLSAIIWLSEDDVSSDTESMYAYRPINS